MKSRFDILIPGQKFDLVKRKGWNQNTEDGYVIKRGTDIGYGIGKESVLLAKNKFDKMLRKAQNIALARELDKNKDLDSFLVSAKIIIGNLSAKNNREDSKNIK